MMLYQKNNFEQVLYAIGQVIGVLAIISRAQAGGIATSSTPASKCIVMKIL